MFSEQRYFNNRRFDERRQRTAQANRNGRVRSYRGIPDTVDKEVKAMASAMRVPVGDVVRALLEYGLAAHQQGNLQFDPRPQSNHSKRPFTLYPASR